MRYQVTVGNIGNVCDTNNYFHAVKQYSEYKKQSKSGVGRAGGEEVTLWKDGHPHWTHPAEVELE